MEKMEISSETWYVFEDRFAVSFFEGRYKGYTTIKYVTPKFKLKPDFSKLYSLKINLDLLSPMILRNFVYGISYPFKVSYSSSRLGIITLNSDSQAYDGWLGVRLIEELECEI